MPPKPPRKSLMKCSSNDVVLYEDPDTLLAPVTDENQQEVKVKPVPQPRSKKIPKAECNTSNNTTVDSVDRTSGTTDAESSQQPADHKEPQPVCPPPRPPKSKYVNLSKPPAADNEGPRYVNSIPNTASNPPATSTETIKRRPPPPPLPRPERPPPPSNYIYKPPSTVRLEPEIFSDGKCQSRSPSPDLSVEEVGHYWTPNDSMDSYYPDRPAVPARQPTLPHSTRPPLPPFRPPPRPSTRRPSEPESENTVPDYLQVLPEADTPMLIQGRSTTAARDTEDIKTMLRWLQRESKSDVMAPSLYGLSLEEEIRSFNERAANVKKALRLYNLLMMKRNETLRDIITEFNSISHSLDKVQKKTKTIGIAGGTTGAVGGVTAVLGIALAPMTMGASLIATAVGAGMVASAGGVGAAHAAKANKKSVNKARVEKLAFQYIKEVGDLERCLDFILSGMDELRRHDLPRLQRARVQPDAVTMAQLSHSVLTNNNRKGSANIHTTSSEKLLKAFIHELDQYFTEKDSQKLKKSNESKFSGRIRLLAENLQDDLDHMTSLWEMFSLYV